VDRAEVAAFLERRSRAWLDEDLETYLGLTAEDYTVEASGAVDVRGRAELEAQVRRNYQRFRPVAWEYHEIAVHGSNVLAEWTVTMESRSDGNRWSLHAMSIGEIRDGRLLWWREYRLPIV
jgi:limonene-1,2-epoxide hydrolase